MVVVVTVAVAVVASVILAAVVVALAEGPALVMVASAEVTGVELGSNSDS